jgi:hypothetical protein
MEVEGLGLKRLESLWEQSMRKESPLEAQKQAVSSPFCCLLMMVLQGSLPVSTMGLLEAHRFAP